MSIDRSDRMVGTGDPPITASARRAPVTHHLRIGFRVAAAIARTAVMVALALLAILVLLPAAIAAQAASAI